MSKKILRRAAAESKQHPVLNIKFQNEFQFRGGTKNVELAQ